MDEFLEQFLVESRELVEQASADLLALEENPGDNERLEGAFRAFHTLKGSAAIVDFAAMANVTHVVEDLLAKVRKGQLIVSRGLITDCLAYLNVVTQWLDAMEAKGVVPENAVAASEAFIKRLVRHDAAVPAKEGVVQGVTSTASAILEAQLALLALPDISPSTILSAGMVAANVLVAAGRNAEASELRKAACAAAARGQAARLALAIGRAGTTEQVAAQATPEAGAKVLRVDVARVDDIVRLTGELTVAKNAIGHAAHLAQDATDPAAVSALLREQYDVIDRLIAELQHAVLSIRVLPLRFVFQRFPRLVRDTSETLGKMVKLEIAGEDTEADKVIVENLFEPLLHILRNAMDHGVEPALERASAGKPETATIRLEASRQGDKVVVLVTDDGRGIDAGVVRRIARDRNLLGSDELDALEDREVLDLIFAPGFSTASTVTELSGRGVGMNAVRTGVERLGGSVGVDTRPGQGTTISLTLPFSVLMTRIMTVHVGGQVFGIPFDNIVETARVRQADISAIGAGRAFALRDRTIPVINLGQSLGADFASAPGLDANLVVVSLGGQIGSVEVDRLGERMDVMLRPPEGLLSGVTGVAGTSLLGDGTVLIVLDLQDLLR